LLKSGAGLVEELTHPSELPEEPISNQLPDIDESKYDSMYEIPTQLKVELSEIFGVLNCPVINFSDEKLINEGY
jgi:hypothetical protein